LLTTTFFYHDVEVICKSEVQLLYSDRSNEDLHESSGPWSMILTQNSDDKIDDHYSCTYCQE
jgi:hypothetical protein